jgi:hypothetical protein
MPHPGLKRLNSPVPFIVQSATNSLVETACREIGLKVTVNGLRTMRVEP